MLPGAGLVGRFGDVMFVVAVDGPAGSAEELVAAVESAAEAGSLEVDPASSLARSLGAFAGNGPAFGVVAPVEDGAVLLLHGAATARFEGAAPGAAELSGLNAVTWLEHLLPHPLGDLVVALPSAGAEPDDGWSDLRRGLVPGAGFRLVAGAAEAVTRARATADLPPPVEPPLVEPPPVPPLGARATTAVSAPAGLLVADDGSRVLLDRDYVLGREPEDDPAVGQGAASPVTIKDPDGLVSAVHTRIMVSAGLVRVEDAGSANGTWIAAPGAPEWTAVGQEAVELPVGWSLRLGRRVLTHQPA